VSDPRPDAGAASAGLRHFLLVRHRHNWVQLSKFLVVGASGFVVNLVVYSALVAVYGQGKGQVLALGLHDFHVRGYHVYAMVAFGVANVSNYLLNRVWTFGSRVTHPLREYGPFLLIGLAAQGAGLLILTVLVHPSGFHLDVRVAQAISIVVVTPVSYVGNKLWTFGSVRGHAQGDGGDPRP
jgi:putative flippase GtrA